VKITTLIVDDEPLARRRIRSLLGKEADVEIVQECTNGTDAVDAIRSRRPNLVFLDVQMPEMSGFDVVRALGDELTAAVVFVTAFEQFSVRAFEVHALDYLLKPFHRTRFQETMRRVRQQLANARELAEARQRLNAVVEVDAARREPLDRIAIKTAGKVTIVRATEIDWIEADGNYACLHVGRGVHLLRQTMKSLADQLDPDVFVRIHHSCIVNVHRVRELKPWAHGDYQVLLNDGRRLTSSRSYSTNLRRAFDL
jgi:two-component system, LytTR family, response regulator